MSDIELTIHPQQVADLATRAGGVADRWDGTARALDLLLAEVGEPTVAARFLAEAAVTLREVAGGMRAVADQIEELDGAGRPLGSVKILRVPHELLGVSDAAAAVTAELAWAAYAAGRTDEFVRINGHYATDPRYAAALAEHLDAAAVAEALDTYRMAFPTASLDPEAARIAGGVASLLVALATASTAGRLPFSVDDVVAAVRPDPTGDPGALAGAALLFAPAGIRWSEIVTERAARLLLLDVDVTAFGGDPAAPLRLPGPSGTVLDGTVIDGRTFVLGQVALHPRVAAALVADADLDRLVGRGQVYGDRGRAAREVLLAGTDPTVARGAEAAGRLFAWLGTPTPPEIPSEVHAGLARMMLPYLGSFGSREVPPAVSVGDPLPALDAETSARVLALAGRDSRAALDLERLTLAWSVVQVDRLGGGVPTGSESLAMAGVVGDVWGRATSAIASGSLLRARDADGADERVRTLANHLLAAPFSSVGPVGTVLSAMAVTFAVDLVLPPPTAESEVASALLPTNARRADLLQSMMVRRLVRAPLAGIGPSTPPDASRSSISPELAGRLSTVDPDGIDDLRTWLATHPEERGAAEVLAWLDRSGATFLAAPG